MEEGGKDQGQVVGALAVDNGALFTKLAFSLQSERQGEWNIMTIPGKEGALGPQHQEAPAPCPSC